MEIFLGNPVQKRELKYYINVLRLFHFNIIEEKFSDIRYVPLSKFFSDPVLRERINVALFHKGVEAFYAKLDDSVENYEFFPIDRAFIGLDKLSVTPEDSVTNFGGFYSKYQTYYNIEQVSVGSLLGSYVKKKYNINITTLELLRSYFHDSIHFNTFSSYKFRFDRHQAKSIKDSIHRVQFGFNLKHENGDSFANLDGSESKTTRNLGLVMEGVTDDFCKTVIKEVIDETKIKIECATAFEKIILDEITSTSYVPPQVPPADCDDLEKEYIGTINNTYQYVWSRYYAFLDEFTAGDIGQFKDLMFYSMIEGDFSNIRDYFSSFNDDVLGFDNLFKNKGSYSY
ncbi:hypothetical protein LLH06_10875 [Mucilaginibacter daejeonensis]|uniref:hypothetical protein n=1 Tax=Mucilaginibacter daejeonensis TaxID=398049 RepID=UPI001D1790D0|nr:hypothetical protein [Mucilaginibacter daejeonensis]UEG51477.1 hypothetical protein LLH06_10875 [Mucilaginibacter daejeonensis]